MSETRPFVEIGAYFTVNGENHVATSFTGTITDENGKEHPIDQCRVHIYTKEDIEKAQAWAEKMSKHFNEDGGS